MLGDLWQRKIDRAEELGARYAFAAEILDFFSAISRFQGKFYGEIEGTRVVREISAVENPFGGRWIESWREGSGRFLPWSREVDRANCGNLLARLRPETRMPTSNCWLVSGMGIIRSRVRRRMSFFRARSYSRLPLRCEHVRTCAGTVRRHLSVRSVSASRGRRPSSFGDGGQRSLICSFCLGEWEFRRIVCPGCGEEDPAKLPVYQAEQLEHVRVDACDAL